MSHSPTRTRILSALVAIAIAALIYSFFGDKSQLPLIPLPEAPVRGPIKASASETQWSFPQLQVVDDLSEMDRRRIRNQSVDALTKAYEAFALGTMTEREVEAAELPVLQWRHVTGELTDKAFHSEMAALIQRELKRVEQLHAQGAASEDHLERTRLYVLRERYLADGDPDAYAAARERYFVELAKRHRARSGIGRGREEYYRAVFQALESSFPLAKADTETSAPTEGADADEVQSGQVPVDALAK